MFGVVLLFLFCFVFVFQESIKKVVLVLDIEIEIKTKNFKKKFFKVGFISSLFLCERGVQLNLDTIESIQNKKFLKF